MARVYQREGVWYLDYRDESGKRQRVRTDGGKGKAEKLLAEKVAQVERIRLRLDAAPVTSSLTVGQLCQWWLDSRCPKASIVKETSRLKVNVLETELAALPMDRAQPGEFEARFTAMEKEGYAPAAINRIRAILRAIFNAAAKQNASKAGPLWAGRNPLLDTEARAVPKRQYATLKLEEVPKLLRHIPKEWRGFFAAAIYLALRKGEIAGLKKTHVDLRTRLVLVAASYEAQGTKGRASASGGVHELPIEDVLAPYLEEALRDAPGEYLFPGPDGEMRTPDANPEKILRTALKRAGIVDGYKHSCRRCGFEKAAGGSAGAGRGGVRANPFASHKPFSEVHADDAVRRCPQCQGKLWAEALPRGTATGQPMRFHDMRHSTATILLRAGAPMYRIQRILRHAQISTTIGTYGHLETADLRASLGVFNPPTPPSPDAPVPVRRLKIVGTNAAQVTAAAPHDGGEK